MISNFYVTHIPILSCAVGAAVCIRPESRGRLVRQWQILLPGLLAAGGALILIVYPDISQLLRNELWTLVVGSIAVGAVRGWFMRKDADQNWHFVRLAPARDGRWASNFLVLLAVVESALELSTPPGDHTFLPTVELCTILPAGYLFGRAVLAWLNARQLVHVDLYEP